MNDAKGSGKPFDREVEGATVEAHGVMVTPVARVRGKTGAAGNEDGSWNYAWGTIRPLRMTVRDSAGHWSEIKLAPTQGQVLVGMLFAGLLVAKASLLISWLARRR